MDGSLASLKVTEAEVVLVAVDPDGRPTPILDAAGEAAGRTGTPR